MFVCSAGLCKTTSALELHFASPLRLLCPKGPGGMREAKTSCTRPTATRVAVHRVGADGPTDGATTTLAAGPTQDETYTRHGPDAQDGKYINYWEGAAIYLLATPPAWAHSDSTSVGAHRLHQRGRASTPPAWARIDSTSMEHGRTTAPSSPRREGRLSPNGGGENTLNITPSIRFRS